MSAVLWLVASYLLGAVPNSYLAAKYGAGIDLRGYGSKSLGATNVYRTLGLKYAVPVALFDVAKGVVPVLVFAPRAGPHPWLPLLMGVAAIIGHVFSVFVRFRGGKGVATSAGVLLALAPGALGLAAIAWGLVLAITRYMSLASMTGAIAFPIAVWVLDRSNVYPLGAGIALAAFIVFTHRSNIQRLLAGTENRLGRRSGAG